MSMKGDAAAFSKTEDSKKVPLVLTPRRTKRRQAIGSSEPSPRKRQPPGNSIPNEEKPKGGAGQNGVLSEAGKDELSRKPGDKEKDTKTLEEVLVGERGSPWDAQQLEWHEATELEEFKDVVRDRIASLEYDGQWIEDFHSFKAMQRLYSSPLPRPSALDSAPLPPSSPSLPPAPLSRKLLFFDLDHTLVLSTASLSSSQHTISVGVSGRQIKAGVSVRPFAKECIALASQVFDVGVFTAAQRAYSEGVVELLDPERLYIKHCFFQEDCLLFEGRLVLKDLRIAASSLKDVVLVDNSILSFALQLYNGVPVPSWTGSDSDTALRDLMKYLKPLSLCSDVRLLNQQVFEGYYRSLLED